MADAEAVCAGLPKRTDVRYTGLVLNERGYRRLRDTSLDEAGLGVPVSNTFGERNQGQNVADAVAMAREVIRDGKLTDFPVQVTLAVAFGCPFEGEVPLGNLLRAAEALLDAGPVEIALADTIGVGVPWQVQRTFEALGKLAGDIPMRAHFHDTRNTGIGNAFASLLAGVTTLDASIGGIGGARSRPMPVVTSRRKTWSICSIAATCITTWPCSPCCAGQHGLKRSWANDYLPCC